MLATLCVPPEARGLCPGVAAGARGPLRAGSAPPTAITSKEQGRGHTHWFCVCPRPCCTTTTLVWTRSRIHVGKVLGVDVGGVHLPLRAVQPREVRLSEEREDTEQGRQQKEAVRREA